ncbi:hypothetical protein HAX54_013969 [Datura stramonium]|uniref:Glycosyltransferase n=1 Tax=Datura stramonium TaxID=4076 RepID=A0ABS8TPA9_DATST|nr:hypothetical protein [Datura stramonium]
MMMKDERDVVVVMVPFPAQGHLNQLLHLSRLVSSYHNNIKIYYAGFSTNISQVKVRVHGWNPHNNIHFQEFPTPPSYYVIPPPPPSPPSDHHNTFETTASKVIASVLEASLTLREPVSDFLLELSSSKKTRRVVVIYDSLMAWVVQDIVSIPNAEAYCFHAVSAFATSSIYWQVAQKRLRLPASLGRLIGRFLLPSGAELLNQGLLPSLESSFTQEFLDFVGKQYNKHKSFCSGNLYDTCKVVEGPYLNVLAKFDRLLRRGNQWAIGPFIPTIKDGSSINNNCHHECLKWLDKQEENSVILVSFGTTGSLSIEQIKELATGLEKSEQKFIWVVKDALLPEGEQVQIPEEFEERVEGRGVVLKDWAPQLEILGHSSTGGFLSHCGWNSCIESITMGVPLATWPLVFDQPRNALLVTKVLKIGITVKDKERRDELITSIAIEAAVRKLMASHEGNEMRMRARKLGEKVRQSVTNGGDSKREMDSFIAHITRN